MTKKPTTNKVQKQTIFVVTGETESGDKYGPFVFVKKPTDKQLKAFWRKYCPEEFDLSSGEGGGTWGSYLFASVEEVAMYASVEDFDE